MNKYPDRGILNGSEIGRILSESVERESGGDLHVGPSSLDVHIAPEKGEFFGGAESIKHCTFNVADEDQHPGIETKEQDPIVVGPSEFCLARTDEILDLPPGVMALMHGRSSIGRLGLFVENAGLVDRGFEGSLTLELYNPTANTIEVPAQTRVAQLLFFWQGGRAESAYDGKYQGQHDATASRLYDDPDL